MSSLVFDSQRGVVVVLVPIPPVIGPGRVVSGIVMGIIVVQVFRAVGEVRPLIAAGSRSGWVCHADSLRRTRSWEFAEWPIWVFDFEILAGSTSRDQEALKLPVWLVIRGSVRIMSKGVGHKGGSNESRVEILVRAAHPSREKPGYLLKIYRFPSTKPHTYASLTRTGAPWYTPAPAAYPRYRQSSSTTNPHNSAP